MQKKKINKILKQVLERVNPSEQELKDINNALKKILERFNKRLRKSKINAELFVGGSFAKGSIIKKQHYDVDIFVRFDKKYKDKEISHLTEKVLKKITKSYNSVHGSRDYFRVKIGNDVYLELIPVIKIKNPKQAQNVTDLSYAHVRYIKSKVKSKKLLDEIKIAKTFCHASKCYGAESYINGFSGYSIELLVCYYKGFLNLVKQIAKVKIEKGKPRKIIIDIEKHYKNAQNMLIDMNSSKLQSPIILVDPTYKQRNSLAALSDETFKRFQDACKKFLKAPSIKAFELKETNLKKIKQWAKDKGYGFILIEARTNKQAGGIAGSKLFKFYNFLSGEIERFFYIRDKEFSYGDEKTAKYYFVVKKRKEILIKGPKVEQEQNVKEFKKTHKNFFIKAGRIYSKERVKHNIKGFLKIWKEKNKKRIKEMAITNFLCITNT